MENREKQATRGKGWHNPSQIECKSKLLRNVVTKTQRKRKPIRMISSTTLCIIPSKTVIAIGLSSTQNTTHNHPTHHLRVPSLNCTKKGAPSPLSLSSFNTSPICGDKTIEVTAIGDWINGSLVHVFVTRIINHRFIGLIIN